MEKKELWSLIKISTKMNVSITVQDTRMMMSYFNSIASVEKYELLLEKLSGKATIEQMIYFHDSKESSIVYFQCMINQFNKLISAFYMVEGYWIHKSLQITDTDSNNYSFSEMPDEIKQKISAFITIQRKTLIGFISNFKEALDVLKGHQVPLMEKKMNYQGNGYDEKTDKYDREVFHRDVSDKSVWLDNEDVCRILKISKRTLQSYRDKGLIPYYHIGKKIYYKKSDIDQIIEMSKRTGKFFKL